MRQFLLLWLLFLVLPSYALAGNECGFGLGPCAQSTVQGGTKITTQTTGAVTTAVASTLTASPGNRHHIYSVEARCNTAAATSGLTITDGGTTIWSSVGTEVLAANNFVRTWPTGLTGATNSAVVITLAACTAGTGTLIVQADTY